MTKPIDMLVRVQAELHKRGGELRTIASGSGIHYDTVRRIKAGSHDPGYSKVKRLAVYLGITKVSRATRQHAEGTR